MMMILMQATPKSPTQQTSSGRFQNDPSKMMIMVMRMKMMMIITLRRAPPKCPTQQTYKTPSGRFQARLCQEAGNIWDPQKCQNQRQSF